MTQSNREEIYEGLPSDYRIVRHFSSYRVERDFGYGRFESIPGHHTVYQSERTARQYIARRIKEQTK